MEEHGIDFRRELELFEAFRRWLNDGVRSLPEPLRKQAVLLMVATTAAAEHFTASLAGYVLSDNTWGETDVDPEMAHLFLWHAAEEVERSEEHTSELQSLMRISYAVFCLKKKKRSKNLTRGSTNKRRIDISTHKHIDMQEVVCLTHNAQ